MSQRKPPATLESIEGEIRRMAKDLTGSLAKLTAAVNELGEKSHRANNLMMAYTMEFEELRKQVKASVAKPEKSGT